MRKSLTTLTRGRVHLVLLTLLILVAAMATLSPEYGDISYLALFGLGIVYTEGNRLGDILLDEAPKAGSRTAITVASGQNLGIGAVLGRILRTIGAPTADGGNTGDGIVNGHSMGPDTVIGTYVLECITAAADGGTFSILAPDGDKLPDAVVGVAYVNDQLNFLINDGAADFIVSDKFTIAITETGGEVVELDTIAVDGTEVAYGILTTDVDASEAAKAGVAISRLAIAKAAGLVWPDGISAGDKAVAISQLEAAHITIREVA